LYVWAVGQGRVLDGSLGYFINPLVNVLLGVLVLSERLNKAQWSSVALAGAGVAYLWWQSGVFRIVALSLAVSFSAYGLLRKLINVSGVAGLAAETLLLSPFALATLWWLRGQGALHFGTTPFFTTWLVLSGLVTAVPLALFALGARIIPYSTVGIIQYMAPTLQMLCGVLVFGEPFPRARAVGFVLIWSALVVYAADSLLKARRARAQRA
jgi:chloramphenicol-sensitive protein RarD